jgi:hypothetical protein
MLRSKSRHKKCHSVFPEENSISEYFLIGTPVALIYRHKKERLKMRNYRSYRSYNSYSSYSANNDSRYDENSDDGYDAAKDAYLMGYGPAVTESQRREEESLREEYRRNGW